MRALALIASTLLVAACVAEEAATAPRVPLPMCAPDKPTPAPSDAERAALYAKRTAPPPAPVAIPAPAPTASAAPAPHAPPAPKRLAIKPTENAQKCGEKNKPCPLQSWMRLNIAPFLAGEDAAGLGRGLERAAALSPDPSWDWAEISNKAAAAAKAGDIETARKSCRSCHDKYKNLYKEKYRTRPVR